MPNMIRTSFTLPPDVNDDLSYAARRLGVTRSALVADVLRETMQTLVPVLRNVPENPSGDDVKRFRGDSRQLVDERLESARRLRDDLFSDLPAGEDGDDR